MEMHFHLFENSCLKSAHVMLKDKHRLERSFSSLLMSTDCRTPGHVTCLRLLCRGYADGFVELYTLMKKSRAVRATAVKEEQRVVPELLENEPSVLNIIEQTVVNAEEANRAGYVESNYASRLKLAYYFHEEQVLWLAEHFYSTSLDVISQATHKDGKKMIEALERMGLLKEQEGQLSEALELMEDTFKLSDEYNLEKDEVIQQSLCLITHRLCMNHGIISEQQGKEQEALSLYKRALNIATQAGKQERIAAAHEKVGKLLAITGNNEAAIRHYEKYLTISQEREDTEGICYAYIALSHIYKNLGNVGLSLKYLQKCQELAQEHSLNAAFVSSCFAMGQLYTVTGKYVEADEQFRCAFQRLKEKTKDIPNHASQLDLARVFCGVSKGHLLLPKLAEVLRDQSRPALMKVLRWKATGEGLDPS